MTSITTPCRICHQMLCDRDTGQTICLNCATRLPASLIKADSDPFYYAAKLTDGTEIHFGGCEITGEYVRLFGTVTPPGTEDMLFENLPHSFPRGLDVRIDQILWCADAPDGS